jgi:hypothetical protein
MARYLAGADPTKVISAKADIDPQFPRVDVGTTATLAFPTPRGNSGPADGLTATLTAHLKLPQWFGFLPQWPKVSVRVTGTRGTVELFNFPGPWLYHYITVESSEHEGGPMRKRTEKQYGKLGWTTQVSLYPCASSGLMPAGSVCRYRYQLEAFIDRLRGRNPEHWHDAQDSVTNMEWIEAIYKEVSPILLSLAFTLTHPFLLTNRRGWGPARHRQPKFPQRRLRESYGNCGGLIGASSPRFHELAITFCRRLVVAFFWY